MGLHNIKRKLGSFRDFAAKHRIEIYRCPNISKIKRFQGADVTDFFTHLLCRQQGYRAFEHAERVDCRLVVFRKETAHENLFALENTIIPKYPDGQGQKLNIFHEAKKVQLF